MPRLLRVERAGVWYHITARGNERRPIYRDDRDRLHFLSLLPNCIERFRCRLHAYVLMENHYHLLLETREANLGRALQWLNTSYSVWFNRRHQRVGHLFQGRFKGVLVEPETWALGLSRYLHLNPVRVVQLGLDKPAQRARRRGLSQPPGPDLIQARLTRLRGYRWSSYRAYAGLEKAPPWLESCVLLSFGGGRFREQRARYRDYVEQVVREGYSERPWESLLGKVALGSREFLKQLLEESAGADAGRERARALAERPSFTNVIEVVERLKGEKWEEFKERHGDWGRDLALYLGRELGGLSLPELGQLVGGRSSMAVSMALKRLARRLVVDDALVAAVKKSKAELLIV